MELSELFIAVDKATSLAKVKRDTFDSVEKEASANIARAQMMFDSAKKSNDEALLKASKELDAAVSSARGLQEELQSRLTGFLNTQGNVKISA